MQTCKILAPTGAAPNSTCFSPPSPPHPETRQKTKKMTKREVKWWFLEKSHTPAKKNWCQSDKNTRPSVGRLPTTRTPDAQRDLVRPSFETVKSCFSTHTLHEPCSSASSGPGCSNHFEWLQTTKNRTVPVPCTGLFMNFLMPLCYSSFRCFNNIVTFWILKLAKYLGEIQTGLSEGLRMFHFFGMFCFTMVFQSKRFGPCHVSHGRHLPEDHEVVVLLLRVDTTSGRKLQSHVPKISQILRSKFQLSNHPNLWFSSTKKTSSRISDPKIMFVLQKTCESNMFVAKNQHLNQLFGSKKGLFLSNGWEGVPTPLFLRPKGRTPDPCRHPPSSTCPQFKRNEAMAGGKTKEKLREIQQLTLHLYTFYIHLIYLIFSDFGSDLTSNKCRNLHRDIGLAGPRRHFHLFTQGVQQPGIGQKLRHEYLESLMDVVWSYSSWLKPLIKPLIDLIWLLACHMKSLIWAYRESRAARTSGPPYCWRSASVSPGSNEWRNGRSCWMVPKGLRCPSHHPNIP